MAKARLIPALAVGMLVLTGCQQTKQTTEAPSSSLPPSSSSSSSSATPVDYTNPVFTPVLADPSAIRGDDGYYYVYGTQDYGRWGIENKISPGPILRSKNLVDYEYVGSVFKNTVLIPDWGTLNAGIWAPDVVKIGDTYNYYYSLSVWGDPDPGIGVATAPTPAGPFTDHGKIFTSNEIGVSNSIDPCVFQDQASGKIYMVWGSFCGNYIVELTEDGLALKDGANAVNTKVKIANGTNFDLRNYEGCYIVQKDGYYYLFVSSGSCCEGVNSSYHVRVARATSPLGPYVGSDGLDMMDFSRGDMVIKGDPSSVTGVGHNAVVQDDAGDYWIIYHGYDVKESDKFGTSNRRSLFIDKLLWTDAGYPYVENYKASYGKTARPVITEK